MGNRIGRILALGPRLTSFGIGLSALGVALYYLLERQSFVDTGNLLFSLLLLTSLLSMLLGPLLLIFGGVLWAWRTNSRNLAICGASLIAVGWLVPQVVVLNVHGWSGSLFLPILSARLLGMICLILPIGRIAVRLVRS